MTREWKPGDVAMVTWNDASLASGRREIKTSIAIRDDGHWVFGWNTCLADDQIADPRIEANVRPLLVIDPENREQVTQICDLIPWLGTAPNLVDDMQAALRSMLVPEPEEPTGAGSVVRDSRSATWIRMGTSPDAAWICPSQTVVGAPATVRMWHDLPRPLTVLHTGWEAES